MSIPSTIAAVIDSKHAEGATVTVTGIAGGRPDTTEGGQHTASFLLIDFDTAVRVHLGADVLAKYGDLTSPPVETEDDAPRGLYPPRVTVTGDVTYRPGEVVPTLTATEITSGEVAP